jgi:hypothetical protein
MSFYRDRSGELVEAVLFKGGHVNGDYGLCFNGDDAAMQWVCTAMNAKTLELSALGSALVLNYRGGSYGLAAGDWVIRKRGGELTHCRGDRFASQYERVDG